MYNQLILKNPNDSTTLLTFNDKISSFRLNHIDDKSVEHQSITWYKIVQWLFRRNEISFVLTQIKRSELQSLENFLESYNWVLKVYWNKQKTFLDSTPKCRVTITNEDSTDYSALSYWADDYVDIEIKVTPLTPNL